MSSIIIVHSLNNIAFSVLGFGIKWYSLAYIFGIFFGLLWALHLDNKQQNLFCYKWALIEDFVFYVAIGIIFGGRLGYVILYNPQKIVNPLEVIKLWNGGMSFHGGVIGVVIAIYMYAKKHQTSFFYLCDIVSCAAPIGIFLGRIANFINGELYGRTTNGSWGVIFRLIDDQPRHPSQLYEALGEGLFIFIALNLWIHLSKSKNYGIVSGYFALLYGSIRSALEMFREPDNHIGYLFGVLTMGQILSSLTFILGLLIIFDKIIAKKE